MSSEIVMVRHGQANSEARDEAGYDRLSDLGRTQARWLGEHLANAKQGFDQVLTGTMTRQIDTARAMGWADAPRDPRLDELDYFALSCAMEAERGVPAPKRPTDFAGHLPGTIDAWMDGALKDVPETFAEFSGRVGALLDEIGRAPGRALLVTSGGVISAAMQLALGLDSAAMAKIMLSIENTSMHRLAHGRGGLCVRCFNATPHLDAPERERARTWI